MIPVAFSVAFVAGWVSISFEVIFFRVYSLATGAAPLVFGVMLSAFLLGVAAGSMLGGKWSARYGVGDARLLLGVAVCLMGASATGFTALPLIGRVVANAHWAASLPLVVVTAGMLGAIFPIVAQFAIPPLTTAGPAVGGLYLANILGSVGGGLATGYVLLDRWPMREVAVFLALVTGVAAALLVLLTGSTARQRVVLASAFAGIVMLYPAVARPAFHHLHERLQYRRHYKPHMSFERIVENRSGVITVTKTREVFGGGAYDGMISTSLRDDRNSIVRAYAVSAFHPAPRRVLMIGLATGAWAQVIANQPGVDSLTIIEINPGYLKLIPRYPEVSSILENPRVRIVIDDGRRWLNRNTGERFDAIVANTTFHWRAHSTSLLSSEYLELVKSRLAPGGIYYYNTTRSDDALVTSFTVFRHGLRFLNMGVVSESPVSWDSVRMRNALSKASIDGVVVLDTARATDRQLVDSIVALGTRWGPAPHPIETRASALARLAHAEIVTDDNMLTEWRGAPLRRLLSAIAR